MSIEKKIDSSLYTPYDDTDNTFEFDTPSGRSGIRWDAIYVEIAPSPEAGMVPGKMDTSQIDAYRQGIELQSAGHYALGTVKIYEGDKSHFSRQNHFGQRTILQNYDYQKVFVDVDTFEQDELNSKTSSIINLLDYRKTDLSSISDNYSPWISSLPTEKKPAAKKTILFEKNNSEPLVKKITRLEYANDEGCLEPIDIRKFNVEKGSNNKDVFHTTKSSYASGNESETGFCSEVVISEKVNYTVNNPYVDSSLSTTSVIGSERFITTKRPDYRWSLDNDPFIDIETNTVKVQAPPKPKKVPTGIIINSNMKNDVDLINALFDLNPDENVTYKYDDVYMTCGMQQEHSRYGTDSFAFSKDFRGPIQMNEEEIISLKS